MSVRPDEPSPPSTDGARAVETPEEHVAARRPRRWLWTLLAAAGGGLLAFALLASRCGAAERRREVEALTDDAHRFVALVRSDLPPGWSIEKVLEFPALRPGSQAMQSLQHERGQARVNLESKANALLPDGERPDLSGFTAWIARPSWLPRATIDALAGELRTLDAGLTALRKRHGLDPRPLPLGGEPVPPLPARIELPPLPAGVEHGGVHVWPMAPAVAALRWGYSPGMCRSRAFHCVTYQVTWLGWDGGVIATAPVASPPASAADWFYGAGPDGALYTVAVEPRGSARVSIYRPESPAPQVGDLALRADRVRGGPNTAGFVIDAWRRDVLTSYVVRDGPTLSPYDGAGEPIDWRTAGLDRRDGARAIDVDAGTLDIQRADGVLYSAYTPYGAKAPEAVFRMADFTAQSEELLREVVIGRSTGLVLELEGSMGSVKVMLSQDAGRTWIGARPE